MSDSLRSAMEAQALRDGAFAQLQADINNFNPSTGDVRQFYLYTVLTAISDLTDGEVRLLAPLVKEKLGIPQAALIVDVAEQKRKMAAIEKENTADGSSIMAEEKSGTVIMFNDPEPWPAPVKTGELLDEVVEIVRRFVVLGQHDSATVALYILLTWIHEKLRVSPILGIRSPQMRCGKTTLLSIIQAVVRRGLAASNISCAALFRAVEKFGPTLCVDEADTFLKDNDELRGIINSGHTRETAFVIRTVGDSHEARIFSTWCPKIIALIGNLPPTIHDRGIVINMARKRPDEKIQHLRLDRMDEFVELKRKCARWMQDCLDFFQIIDPDIPSGLNDRATDNWTPLLAIADLAGGEWPEKARGAAIALSDCDGEDDTAVVMLLRDIRDYFEATGVDRIKSADLCSHLVKMEERPWSEWCKGKPITTRQVARLLNPFGIISVSVRIGNETPKGYKRESFAESFSRYLPDSSATPPQINEDAMIRIFQPQHLK